MEDKKMNRPYPVDAELFSIESLSWDLENDFLNKSKFVESWKGGSGVYIVKVNGNFHSMKDALKSYSKTRVYMYPKVEIFSNATFEVIITIV